jgi:hypothetical protein
MKELYISVDIETNGLVPGLHSMISLGAAAFDIETGVIHGIFHHNLEPLDVLEVDIETMDWWKQYPEAYEQATQGAKPAIEVMRTFVKWIEHVKQKTGAQKVVFAAWKPDFDLGFVRFYLGWFGLENPGGRAGSGFDIKTAASLALGIPYSETKVSSVTALWLNDAVHTHNAVEDAAQQAKLAHLAYKTLKSARYALAT